ncbi:KpsF/GutQ family sugar-phosphate isomerase [Rickettsiales bacterium]|nr:KpsF/GutQ family sugar-phosphate isomerase [Rickettsiales bacterium]
MQNNISNIQSDIKIAKDVLDLEIEGLKALEEWLGEEFSRAVDLIYNLKGRVVVSGMGKSGHIANKIVATLASTGTPSIFVHPGEASHGDLGMITKDDAIILLSNSGETSELRDIINYACRFSIPLIAIVRRKSSILVDSADVALILPDVPEACDVKAPTTSTTMMLALGDAIAVTLLERRGFNKEDFNVFHPGGKLGAAFIKIADLMHDGDETPLVKNNTTMSEVLIEMTAKRFGCAGVISDGGDLEGVITDGDLRRHMSGDLVNMSAEDVMTKNPVTIAKSSLASEALAIMQNRSITSLFVLDGQKPVGIVHIHDLLRAGVV